MKFFFLLFLMAGLYGRSQTKSFILSPKGDTLNRVDIKGLKQGPWVIHVDEIRGERGYEEEGFYADDKKQGVWRKYSLEGDLTAVESYAYGMKNGRSLYYTNAGEPLREESWKAIDPRNPYDTVDIVDVNDPTKVLKKQIVKVEPISYKHGTWRYYNTLNGTIEATEDWVMNKIKEKPRASDDDMAPVAVTDNEDGKPAKAEKKTPAKPQAILDYEKKNSGKKKVTVRDGRTGG